MPKTVLDPLERNTFYSEVSLPLHPSMLFIDAFFKHVRRPIAVFSKYPQQNLLGALVKNAQPQGPSPRPAESSPLAGRARRLRSSCCRVQGADVVAAARSKALSLSQSAFGTEGSRGLGVLTLGWSCGWEGPVRMGLHSAAPGRLVRLEGEHQCPFWASTSELAGLAPPTPMAKCGDA